MSNHDALVREKLWSNHSVRDINGIKPATTHVTNGTDVHIITVLVPRHGNLPDVGIAPAIFPCCQEQNGEQLVNPWPWFVIRAESCQAAAKRPNLKMFIMGVSKWVHTQLPVEMVQYCAEASSYKSITENGVSLRFALSRTSISHSINYKVLLLHQDPKPWSIIDPLPRGTPQLSLSAYPFRNIRRYSQRWPLTILHIFTLCFPVLFSWIMMNTYTRNVCSWLVTRIDCYFWYLDLTCSNWSIYQLENCYSGCINMAYSSRHLFDCFFSTEYVNLQVSMQCF